MSIIASLIILNDQLPVIKTKYLVKMLVNGDVSKFYPTCGNTLTLVSDIRDSVTRHISDTCYVTDTDSG